MTAQRMGLYASVPEWPKGAACKAVAKASWVQIPPGALRQVVVRDRMQGHQMVDQARDRYLMPSAPPIAATALPPDAWVSIGSPQRNQTRDKRVWATLAFVTIAVMAGVFGSFAPWLHYADGVSGRGVDHADGWIVIGLITVGAGLGGAVAVGVRHLGLRLGIAACGLVVFGSYLIDRWSITHAHDQLTSEPLVVGGGLYVVAFAGLGLVIASLAMPSSPWRGTGPTHTAVNT